MIVLVCTGYQTWCDAETFSGRMIGDPVTPDMYFVHNVMVKDPKIKNGSETLHSIVQKSD